ncbi:MAG: hypothetical protein OXJ54_07235 [Gemmatimonadetes bacterium]|nr:hypothetical protein [Candidatus Palauibacter rhopaloidicola]
MTPHLNGRENALEALGWTGDKAEWIALTCLHSGVFTRAQCARFLGGAHPEQVRRIVHALIAEGLAAEETVPGLRGIGRVCRIYSRRIYRALGAEHIRHRRDASSEVLLRRLLSLDYVIEHSDLPWLPTEPEKVAAFEGLGIERALLPSRLYRGAAGDTRRYFPVKLPVALESARAVFVYAEPGHETATALRSWGAAHGGLWKALQSRGRAVEIVAAARTVHEIERARRVIRGWAEPSRPGEPDAGTTEELARIERAIIEGVADVLEEFGGLQAAMQRSVALEEQALRPPRRGWVSRTATWQTMRLQGVRYR